jgi:hypothetical protein
MERLHPTKRQIVAGEDTTTGGEIEGPGFVGVLTPSLDNTSCTKLKIERLAPAVGSVELGSIARKGAPVVHVNFIALDCFAYAFHFFRDLYVESLRYGGNEQGGGKSEDEGRNAHFGGGSERIGGDSV